MANGYSLPPWLVPKSEPWQALVAGVQAGSQIAATRQRGRQIAMQYRQQALQEEVLRTKAANDAADLDALREWWPRFAAAEGDELRTLQPPMVRNPQVLNRLQTMVQERKFQAATADLATTLSAIDLATPEGQAKYWETIRKNPAVAGKSGIDALMAPIKTAETLKRLEDNAKAGTSAMKNLTAADQMELEASSLDQTDPTKAENLRRNAKLLRSTITAPTETIESYVDDQGRQQFRIVRGPTTGRTPTDVTKPTVATLGKVQERLISAQGALELATDALANITPEAMGVRGLVNQVVINEGLAQLFPGLHKGQVTTGRTLLGQFRESAIKAIKSDAQINEKERKGYLQLIPDLGALETVQTATDKINTFKMEFRKMARTNSEAVGLPVPNWALTQEEITSKFQSGELTEEEAVKLLMRYH